MLQLPHGHTVKCPKCGRNNPKDVVNCLQCETPLPKALEHWTLGSDSDSDHQETIGVSSDSGDGVTRLPSSSRPVAAGKPVAGSGDAGTLGGTSFAIAAAGQTVDFGPRYRVEAMLGEGGMGAVYKAYDLELDRMVALKLVRPDLTRDPKIYQRFKQELLLASKISHKNILRTHDLGEAAGIKFISMSYVEGQDLHHLIATAGKLPVPRAVHIARQLCAALDAAHSEGVVHRDLKPQNVLVDPDDNIYISDFGLAKSLESDLGMTHTGQLLGTPRYMSPEQAEAKAVDHRSDLYAFGLILCEMLTGDIPFETTTSVLQMMFQRVQSDPKNPKTLDPDMPAYLAQIIRKCLERDPERRYQSAHEILADLDAGRAPTRTTVQISLPSGKKAAYIAIPVLAVLLVIAAIVFRSKFRAARPARSQAVTVLVADFTNHTSDPVFDGTLEPMFNVALEGASFINAYRRGSAHQIAKQSQPAATMMDESVARLVAVREGVEVVVSGSIARDSAGYRISARAVDANTGKQIAAGELTVPTREAILGAIGKLATPIRNQLGDTTPESAQLAAEESFTTSSLDAAHLYSMGQEAVERGQMEQATQDYKKAVQSDPNMGRAWAGLAVASVNLKKMSEASAYYKKTLSLLDHMSERERYRTLGTYYAAFLHNYPQAVESYQKLVFLYPGDTAAYNNLSIAYVFMLDFPKAIAAVRHAIESNPHNLQWRLNYALYSMYAGDFATAASESQGIIQENPSYQFAYLPLAISTLARGDADAARAVYARFEKISPAVFSVAKMGEADLDMYFGHFKKALEILDVGIRADQKDKNTGEMALKYVAKGEAYLALGQKQEAVQAAAKAAELSSTESVLYPAARVLLQAGDEAKARKIASVLDNSLQAQNRSYAKLISGEIEMQHKRFPEAVEAFREAQELRNSWIAHFLLGRAYLDAAHYPEALAEFETCKKRLGETADLMFADTATLRYLPPLYYWLAKAQQGTGITADAKANYEKFLSLRDESADPLVNDARAAVH